MTCHPGRGLAIAAVLLSVAPHALAQVRPTPPSQLSQYKNTVGGGISYGPFLDRDASFWGLGVDYGRQLPGRWSIGSNLSFDRETDDSSGTRKSSDTLSATVVVNYSLRWIALTTGLSKGFADTDRPGGTWEFVNGDWGTGLIVGVTLPSPSKAGRVAITLSTGYEYNLTEKEPDISFDVGVGFAF